MQEDQVVDREGMVVGKDKGKIFGEGLTRVNEGANKGKGATPGDDAKIADGVHLSVSHGVLTKGPRPLRQSGEETRLEYLLVG